MPHPPEHPHLSTDLKRRLLALNEKKLRLEANENTQERDQQENALLEEQDWLEEALADAQKEEQ